MLWLIFALFSILYVLHISQSLHIVTLPSKISFKVFINSSSSSIKCISTLLGKRHSNVFSAKSLDEKEISDKMSIYYTRHDELIIEVNGEWLNEVGEVKVEEILRDMLEHQVDDWIPFKIEVVQTKAEALGIDLEEEE